MNTVVDYQIVVPSRRRSNVIRRLLSLLPTASVCVDESELAEYAKVVPKPQLVVHPTFDRMSKIRNWVLDHYQSPAIAMFDDDLQFIRSMAWPKTKRYTDPLVIQGVIENMVNLTSDLELSLGCWSRMQHPAGYSHCDAFGMTSPVSSGFVINGRKLRFDERLSCKADLDISLQALLNDRIVLCDRRWYFHFGVTFGNPGGDQGTRTMDRINADNKLVKSKWQGHAVLDAAATSGQLGRSRSGTKQSPIASFRIAVQRRSHLGSQGH